MFGLLCPLNVSLTKFLPFEDTLCILVDEHVLFNRIIVLHNQTLRFWPHELPFIYSRLVVNHYLILPFFFVSLLESWPIAKCHQITNIRVKVWNRRVLSLQSELFVLLLVLQ